MGEDLPGAKSRCTKSSVTTLIEQFLAPPQGPYYIVCDSAFGADTEYGREVVFLDSLDDIEFRKRGELKNLKVYEFRLVYDSAFGE